LFVWPAWLLGCLADRQALWFLTEGFKTKPKGASFRDSEAVCTLPLPLALALALA
jgi:hypothetical protein